MATVMQWRDSTYTHYCVLDFEATCWDTNESGIVTDPDPRVKGQKGRDLHECIEFPSILLKADGTEVSRFQQYVKPKERPWISKFCLGLTGITEDKIRNGISFPQALQKHYTWLSQHVSDPASQVCIVTFGAWDLATMIRKDCHRWNINNLPQLYQRFINVKTQITDTLKWERYFGMDTVLQKLGLELEGRHHSGIDDCHNIARIVRFLLNSGQFKWEDATIYLGCGEKRYRSSPLALHLNL